MSEPKKCPVCSSMRQLDDHLYELAKISELLGSRQVFGQGEEERVIDTHDISQWLLLSAQLGSVEIDTWKYAGLDGTWCRPASEMYDSDSKHYSGYCTYLTKFIYTYNFFEELCKYLQIQTNNCTATLKLRSHALKVGKLLESNSELVLPKNCKHLFDSFTQTVNVYKELFDKCFDLKLEDKSISFALDNLRVLRNQIAHGTFPIADNPEYSGYNTRQMPILCALLTKAIRTIGLYTQLIYLNYTQGFNSYGSYFIDTLENHQVDSFLYNHLRSLHMQTDFGFKPEQFSLWEEKILNSYGAASE